MRLLLVEDDTLLADGLARALRQAHYQVDVATDGKTADRWLELEPYDICILDLGLPGLDGSEVLRRLRQRRQHVPVLVVSAREAIDERVRLLNLGADDFLVKPVALTELEARIRAIARRGQALPETHLQLGRLVLDTQGRRAWLDGDAIDLTAREWAALEFLATRVNRIVSKEQLMQSFYGWDEDITPNAVEKFVSRLRAKMEPAGITIRTVRGLGYYLEKPAEHCGE